MQKSQSTKEKLKSQEDRSQINFFIKKKILVTGTIIGVSILLAPYFFSLYQIFPDNPTWESFLGTYTSTYYESAQVMAWTLFGKIVPLYLLVLWFLTCKHWWYHVILVPICMYIIQIFIVLSDEVIFADVDDIFLIAPLVLFVGAFCYVIRTRIFDKLYGIDYDQELKRVRWNGKIVSIPADSPLDLPEVGDDEVDEEEEEDDDKEPSFMG